MQYVEDVEGYGWELDLNLGNADRLDAFLKENFDLDLFDAVQVISFLGRPTNVVSFASCLCRDQREKLGLEPEDFGRRWKGDAAYKLQRALWEEYRFFYPNPAIQDLISSTLKQLNDYSVSEGQLIKKALDQLTVVMREALEQVKSTIEGGSLS